jgi:DNA invertase Pin-like site-specific DNA recombinase
MSKTENQGRVVRDYIQRGHYEQAVSVMPITAKKVRVAAYCRVSTKDEDQLNSYEAQVEFYTGYIASKPEWEFVGIYADEGITGTKLKRRKEFNRLIDDAMNDLVDLIIVKSVSRFARNTVDSLSVIRNLRAKNVKVFFEKENIDSLDSKCDMVLSIYSSLAEEESRSISTNIRWRKQKQVEAGEVSYNLGLLYGFRQEKINKETGEKHPVTIFEPEAEVIRDIYFKFLIGASFRDIARDLNDSGYYAPKRRKWYTSTIMSILENEKYAGDMLLQKTYARDFLSDRRVLNTGQAPQKYVENNHPAIIDRVTWNAVQAERQRRATLRTTEESGKGRYSGLYAFSGKMECGLCGAGYRRHASRGQGVWVCKQHMKAAVLCAQLAIKESYLMKVFVNTINSLIIDRDRAIDTVGTAVKEALAETGGALFKSDELQRLDDEIDSLQAAQIELSKKRSRRELDADAYNNESRIIMARMDGLFAARDNLAEKQSEANLSVAYQEIVEAFMENAQEQDKFDKDVFAQLVDKICIKDRDNILFVLKDGTEVQGITEGAEA